MSRIRNPNKTVDLTEAQAEEYDRKRDMRDRIYLALCKMGGHATSRQLSDALGITAMSASFHAGLWPAYFVIRQEGSNRKTTHISIHPHLLAHMRVA
jgi:hypothetical protein